MNTKQEQEAIFWCNLLRSVLFEDLDKDEIRQELRALSKNEVVFPSGVKRKPSLSTLKRKFKKYSCGGFNSMGRKQRNDIGQTRAVDQEIIATAIAAKKEQPKRSPIIINQILKKIYGQQVPRSTLYRHLKNAGATCIKLGATNQKVRKRWTCEHSNDMWAGDFEYGPYVMVNGKSVQSYLSAFIDVCSRLIVSARYYVHQNFDVLTDTMVRGFTVHGTPRHVYLDNGKVYHSKILKLVCYRLKIGLLHRPVRDPAAGGIIERFFKTVQSQFESEVNAGEILTLDRLNQGFDAWLNVVYHQTENSDTCQCPAYRYNERLIAIRQADMEAVAESFLQHEQRIVNKTFSDIRLHNRYYKVDPRLRGDRLNIRYDLRSSTEEILLYSLRDEYLGKGILHHREEGQCVQAEAPKSKVRFNVIDMFIELNKAHAKEPSGIDYSGLQQPSRWSFDAFVACMADLLGHKGGISSFDIGELKILKQVHDQHPNLTRALLKEAFAQVECQSIPAIVHALQEQCDKKPTDEKKED